MASFNSISQNNAGDVARDDIREPNCCVLQFYLELHYIKRFNNGFDGRRFADLCLVGDTVGSATFLRNSFVSLLLVAGLSRVALW